MSCWKGPIQVWEERVGMSSALLLLFTWPLSHAGEVDNQVSSGLVFIVGSGVVVAFASEVFNQSIISDSLCLNYSSIFPSLWKDVWDSGFSSYQLLGLVQKRVLETGNCFHDEIVIPRLFKMVAFAMPLLTVLLALCLSLLWGSNGTPLKVRLVL